MWYFILGMYILVVKHPMTASAIRMRPVIPVTDLFKSNIRAGPIQRNHAQVEPQPTPVRPQTIRPATVTHGIQQQSPLPIRIPPTFRNVPLPTVENPRSIVHLNPVLPPYVVSAASESESESDNSYYFLETETITTTPQAAKVTGSTKPPYPGGIIPETEEISGDYHVCGQADCHRFAWTTKRTKQGQQS